MGQIRLDPTRAAVLATNGSETFRTGDRARFGNPAFTQRLQSASDEAETRANNRPAFSNKGVPDNGFQGNGFTGNGFQKETGTSTFRLTPAGEAQLYNPSLPRGSLIDVQA